MVNAGKHLFSDDQCIDAADQNPDVEESVDVSSTGIETPATANPSILRRLTDIFLEDGNEDLLLQRTDIGDGFLQLLEALDLQVMGGCRADERLKPLLKLNISGGEAEDRLLAQLCEHFEPSEVGLLARCLCAPLVSIRVGKINKKGTLLCPTSMRGNLCLTLLPTSDLRVSFNGDDGSMERLATLSSEAQCTSLEIEEISADKSGRSFLLRIVDNAVLYFWCSEKSQLLGKEMLRKMKDLLRRKPSLAELTGISEDRLDYFATQFRGYLGGLIVSNAQSSGVLPSNCPSDDDSFDSSKLHFSQSSFTCENMSQFQQKSLQGLMTNPNHLEDIYPKSSSFEASLSKSLSSKNITTAREKMMQVGSDNVSPISLSLASTSDADLSNSIGFAQGKLTEAKLAHSFAVLNVVDAFGTPLDLPLFGPNVQTPSSSSSHLSPQYCWCPVASTLHYTLGNSRIPSLSAESLCLPPFPSLLSAAGSSKSSLSFSEVPAMDFPSFQPEPSISRSISQQIPTFTPLTCEPIVCSTGPGYLVSAGPGTATTIPPLNLNLLDPLISNYGSVVEQSARKTLCMLINSTNIQPNSNLLEILPPVLSSCSDEPNVLGIGGSRGFYCGTSAVPAVSSGPTIMSLLEKSPGGCVGKVCPSKDDMEWSKDTDSSGFDSGIE